MIQDGRSKAAIVASSISSKIQVFIGICLILLLGVTLIVTFSDEKLRTTAPYWFIVSWFILGIWLLVAGIKKAKLIKAFDNYLAILSIDPTSSIDRLAASTGSSVDVVKKNLKKMIKKKYFTNAYFDKEKDTVVLPHFFSNQQVTAAQNIARPSKVEYTTVKCKGCGATNKLEIGTVAECEFCGAMLSRDI